MESLITKALALAALERQVKALKEQIGEDRLSLIKAMRSANETSVRPDATGLLFTLVQTDTLQYRDGGVTEALKIVAKSGRELEKAKALLKSRQSAAKSAGKFRVVDTSYGVRITGL